MAKSSEWDSGYRPVIMMKKEMKNIKFWRNTETDDSSPATMCFVTMEERKSTAELRPGRVVFPR